jgi:threonine/homoserine/homoserine lactone efflux protein
MPDLSTLAMFATTAFVLAIVPGPGQFYILSRTLAAGQVDGYASVAGTAFGGLIHVVASVVGISALIMASATTFTVLKTIGGCCLIYLGIRTCRSAGKAQITTVFPRGTGVTRSSIDMFLSDLSMQ